jgi:hypothetical protein
LIALVATTAEATHPPLSFAFQVAKNTATSILCLLRVLLPTRDFIGELIDALIHLLLCLLSCSTKLTLSALALLLTIATLVALL